MTLRCLGLALAAALSLLPGHASAADDIWVTGQDLRSLITGNTITGRYDNGQPYSEYHAVDGRVLGHNNREPNQEACWDLRGDRVCYYYAKGRARGEFCWQVQRIGANGIRARLLERGSREIIGLHSAGNPHGHTDNGQPWTCDPVTSERKTPRDHALRYAHR
ncbi:MAG: hypothetical protein IOC90_11560 [Methylocystis sp.]|nr:hypothetical protein [Methylocystis sp.]MCA3582652.1 hypothetical protein [Methylocystis sp.]MCA3588655.1 hypothetical protein [Methylocystis sp.]MCA3591675.1 hypothetical protein [Methylocystis sp.]